MPEQERFDVKISLDILKKTEHGKEEFADFNVHYEDMDYGSMVGMEAMMVGLLNKLVDVGITSAGSKGLGNKLEKLGIKPKKHNTKDAA